VTKVAASVDLESWHVEGTAVGGRAHEGPYVLELGGSWWMIVDEWRGMGVHHSDDAVSWVRQGGPDAVILGAGDIPGPGFGHHGAVVREGGDVWFYYFGDPERTTDSAAQHIEEERRSAIYRTRLAVIDGELVSADHPGKTITGKYL